MKLTIYVLGSVILSTFLSGCYSKVIIGNISKIEYRTKNDRKIAKDQVGIQIHLFDFKTKEKVSIDDVYLPGELKDSTMNSKLLIFNKKSIPERIYIKKPKKGTMFFSPEFENNNLLIYKFYLSSSEKVKM